MKKNSAFTLRELVFVVAILGAIVVLTAILAMPNGGCMDSPISATDVANLSSIGKGVQRYLIDTGDVFFKSSSTTPWPVEVEKYLQDWRIMKSPFDKRSLRTSAPYLVSYGLNRNCMDTNATQWTNPSYLLLAADQRVAEKGANQFVGLSSRNPIIEPGVGLGVQKRGKMINCLYGDYHAVATNLTDFRDVQSENGQQRWVPVR